MNALVQRVHTSHTPDTLTAALAHLPGTVLLRSSPGFGNLSQLSLVTTRPFLTFRSWGSRCELITHSPSASPISTQQFGNPWAILDSLMARYEMPDQAGSPFPLGGCFGWWGYDLRTSLEPRLFHPPPNDLDLPDCTLGFHANLVVFDHNREETFLISTGLQPDGSRDPVAAQQEADAWLQLLDSPPGPQSPDFGLRTSDSAPSIPHSALRTPHSALEPLPTPLSSLLSPAFAASSLSRDAFLAAVQRARDYIRAGDIYQVNLAHRITHPCPDSAWDHFVRLQNVSPAPFAAYLNSGDLQLASASPELFLRLNGSTITTRPIKGTRPRSPDPDTDARLARELQSSPKENAELLMITDLLRNDLGRVCSYGSVQVEELQRLERFAQVQHLVSTVNGQLRPGVTHFQALAACFPGGSITGAPKIRAMEIIDSLEPVSRGPYTGCIGYLGFNRQSQLNITIRTSLLKAGLAHFHTGAGIVADSDPAAEYDETLAKAAGFLAAILTQAQLGKSS